jgi:hypothetical protein
MHSIQRAPVEGGSLVNETTFWKPDETKQNNIVRGGRLQDVVRAVDVKLARKLHERVPEAPFRNWNFSGPFSVFRKTVAPAPKMLLAPSVFGVTASAVNYFPDAASDFPQPLTFE